MVRFAGYWSTDPVSAEMDGRLRRLPTRLGLTRRHLAYTSSGATLRTLLDLSDAEMYVPIDSGDGTAIGCAGGLLFNVPALLPSRTMPALNGSCMDSLRVVTDRMWGSYVAAAFFLDGRVALARAPLGLETLYFARYGDGYVFGSRLSDVVALLGRSRPSIRWSYLSSWLMNGPLLSTLTAFDGIWQVRPGTAVELSRSSPPEERVFWSPHSARLSTDTGNTHDITASAIGEAIVQCVTAWMSGRSRVYVDLSGGLDSSTVTWATVAATRSSDVEIVAGYVDYGSTASADEIRFATEVARTLDISLQVIDGDAVLPLTPVQQEPQRWSEPSLHLLHLAWNRAQAQIAGSGSTAMSGAGGDQVFYARPTFPWFLHDHFRYAGWRCALRESLVVSRTTGVPLAPLLSRLAIAELRRRTWPSRIGASLRTATAVPSWLNGPHQYTDDPGPMMATSAWFEGHPTTGQAIHAADVAHVTGLLDREVRQAFGVELLYPLLSQPLVELALRIPIPQLIDARSDRRIVRDAVSGALPASVVRRQHKGDYGGMYQLGIRQNFSIVRDLILDGEAAAIGLIDPELAMEDARLNGLGHSRDLRPLQNLLAVELWLRSWS